MVELVIPKSRRARIVRGTSGLEILVGPARSPAGLLVGAFVTVIAALLLARAWPLWVSYFRHPSVAIGDLILMAFAIAAALFAFNTLYGLLFELAGTEEIKVQGQELHVQRTLGGLGHRASFLLEGVASLRVLDLSRGPYVRGIAVGPSRNGVVAFDYEGRVVRFGDDLDLAEAVAVVDALRAGLAPSA